MKIMTILGTRPEIIRLSLIIHKLDASHHQHILVHTGQNFTSSLNHIFFRQLRIRRPDYSIQLKSHSFGAQIAQIYQEIEHILLLEEPDRLLVLGDTNSALCAILAARMGIPVYHMEAGNRCYDPEVPEETNRILIDSVATYNFPYTPTSRDNLLQSGIHPSKIWVSGNPVFEVLETSDEHIGQSPALQQFHVEDNKYFLVTIHRAESLEREDRLRSLFAGLHLVHKKFHYPVLVSLHPHTRDCLRRFAIVAEEPGTILFEPIGLFDFVRLERSACCVITDSGTVQEECCIYHIPAVTVRNSTERPETLACGSNILAGVNPKTMVDCVDLMLHSPRAWSLPDGYDDFQVSSKMLQFLTGGLKHV